MQTIWPYNLHTTLDGNSNLYNVHAHGRPLAHHHISFAILYSAQLACMQNIGRSPVNQNKRVEKENSFRDINKMLTSSVVYLGFSWICCLKTSMKRSMTVLLNVTPSKMVMGRNIRSCSVLKSKALIRIMNSVTPGRVGFTRIFTNWMVSVDNSLKSCESLWKWSKTIEKLIENRKINRIVMNNQLLWPQSTQYHSGGQHSPWSVTL